MKPYAFLLSTIALILALSAVSCSKTSQSDAEMNACIDSIMAKMTLDEKLGQLNLPAAGDIVTGQASQSNIGRLIAEGKAGGVFNVKGVEKIKELQRIAVEESRLGIPLIFGMDVIHGYETVFPIPFALSCSWDTAAIRRSARIAATEASACGICWTFSPMVDICRDPRWGRMAEGSGEDPFLGAAIARVMVEGYQGDGLKKNDEIMACVKHFALYGAAEAGRDYNTVDMSRQRMFNDYFAPYKAGADAGAGSFMTSFNLVDGIPATANRWLVTDVLRGMWNFDGFVVTDYASIAEMRQHGIGDLKVSSAMALAAGTDMDMVADGFSGTLAQSLEEGKIDMGQIDTAVRRVLEAKYKLGLFADPYKYIDAKREQTEVYTEANRTEARRIATETFVLLKNEGNILPLRKGGRIAVVGPLADTRANMPGTWSVAAVPEKYKTVVEGIRDAVGPRGTVTYAKGSNLYADPELEAAVTVFGRQMRDSRSEEALRAEAVALARSCDVVIAAMGEASESSGEAASRTDISLPDTQKKLLEALLATGKPVVMLNFSGRANVMTWESAQVPAILNVWFGGSEAADAIADVVFGDVSPSGKLTVTMPRSVGQIPIYYSQLNTGRPKNNDAQFEKYLSGYIDSPNSPLYPFGYGLSYTTFSYSDFALSAHDMKSGDTVTASVRVTNTGSREADEIVQLYIRDIEASTSRPLKELKGFRRIHLKPGENATVEFPVTVDLLKHYNYELEYVAEPGEFSIMIGPDSRTLRSATLTLH